MRPHPDDRRSDNQSGRIIYLGEVRRRRSGRERQAPDRHYLAAFALVAAASWGIWVTVLVTLQPARLLTYLAFFLPLGVALGATGAIVAYGVDRRAGRLPGLRSCVRRGGLVSALIVVNLAFHAGRHWSVLVLGVSVLLALAAEAASARSDRSRAA